MDIPAALRRDRRGSIPVPAQYASMDWKFGWAAPVEGGLLFVLWIGRDQISGTPRKARRRDRVGRGF